MVVLTRLSKHMLSFYLNKNSYILVKTFVFSKVYTKNRYLIVLKTNYQTRESNSMPYLETDLLNL